MAAGWFWHFRSCGQDADPRRPPSGLEDPLPRWSTHIPGTDCRQGVVGTFIIPIVQLGKLRLREIEELTREASGRTGPGPQAT